ncbi:para-nitrobenzyl esterase [Algoriphagus sp. 4150]|uniref:carboxylesterase/lipase family protein n=1 Tax=Algoriphagus sp. 4150 TaxID=2817756 RepID=UPI00285D63EC|nr:carboxylesterase family protein [Algoriphagus sp. 4150]MDR7131383.1 para-nitrobenzyl esterase [Algoriphagus sp. 4150]
MKPILQSVRIYALILLLGISASLRAQNNNSFEVQTTIKNGMIAGSYDVKTGVQKYFGIPFAKPPVGELRWKAPQDLDNWAGVKETKKFGPRAVQAPVFGDMDFKSDGISEDCLYLNVWTPADRNTKNLPVLVYFYGGGFVAGDGSEPRYNGEAMAQKGIVVVTVNYRLNIFGFFSHPELSAEAPYKASGNYGLMDQMASLKWVKENIAAFGGDPTKVTIAGESAGSISVSYQMASPLSKDLIAGAIGESGAGINPTLAPTPLAEAEKQGAEFTSNAGFNSIKELRALPTKDIYEIYNESKRFGFPVVLDGYFLPKTLPEIFEAKEQAMVPLLAGWNSAEIPGMAFMQGQPYTTEAFISKVKEVYPNDYEEVLSLHPHTDAKEVERSATDLASDRFIAYSTWKWLDLHAQNSDLPVYRYLYSKLRPPLKDSNLTAGLAGGTIEGGPKAPEAIGAPHACEIEYAMGNLPLVDVFDWTAEDYMVSKIFMNYFANFIKTGNPNGDEQPEWKTMEGSDTSPSVMVIDTESKLINATDDARYNFHDRSYGNIN